MTELKEKISSMSPKARQYLVLGVFGSLFLGGIMMSVKIWGNNTPTMVPVAKTTAVPETKNITALNSQIDPREVWMAKSSEQLQQLDQATHDLQAKMDAMKQQPASGTTTPASGNLSANGIGQLIKPTQTVLPPPQFKPLAQPMAPLPPPVAPNIVKNDKDNEKDKELPVEKPKGPDIAVYDISAAAPQEPVAAAAPPKKPIYIPSGSFMPVVLLGGLDAGTGGQAQNNPWPVLMRVTNNATLPNRFRSKVKECFVLGSGYGDLSSERAYLRLESFSCVMKDGSVVDTQAKGYVAGEDGKAGMRGTLVTKQGQVLANALLSGVVGGIGQGISSSSQSYMTSALGTTSSYSNTTSAIKGGVGTGVGSAMNTLAQYYIQLAEKLFPVIEIDAGRTADVVLTKGLSFDTASNDPDEDYSAMWKRGREAMGKAYNPYPNGVNPEDPSKRNE